MSFAQLSLTIYLEATLNYIKRPRRGVERAYAEYYLMNMNLEQGIESI